MGIAVSELLVMDYFREFHVLAGKKGLHREIQGITVLEAPDATRWSQGKELILTSGYVIMQDPDCIRRAFEEGTLTECSAFMVKRGRYLEKIPPDVLDLFEQHQIPLISMPFSTPWMELMNRINTAVMNRTIRRFRIQGVESYSISDQSYKVRKIRQILQAVEKEMKFPAFLYDVMDDVSHFSSDHFLQISREFGLEETEYWNPSRELTKHTLCDTINMVRYRLLNREHPDDPRVSWITIPIVIDDVVQAYFIVMESREFIDFYDEFSIRIAFLMLQNVFEQIVVARNMSIIGFENYINFALTYSGSDLSKLVHQANMQGIDIQKKYHCVLFRQGNDAASARDARKQFMDALQKSSPFLRARVAFLSENEGVLFFEAEDAAFSLTAKLLPIIEQFKQMTESKDPRIRLDFAASGEISPLSEIQHVISKCRKVLRMGKMFYPQSYIWRYEDLGALAWLDIPAHELEKMLQQYRELLRDEKNIEILKTLEVYLEHNLNYSLTAEKMYVHINTIRKRITKAEELLSIDWSNHVSRLCMVILLRHLHLDKQP